MKYILIFALILSSCATKKLDLSNSATTYDHASTFMDQTPRFGFIAYGHKYDFGIVSYTKDESTYCDYLVGFEDNKLKYFLPEKKITELKQIFEAKISIEEKSKSILAQVQKLHAANYKCENEYSKIKVTTTGGLSVGENVMSFIVYSPLLVLTAPVWIPMMIVDAHKRNSRNGNIAVDSVFSDGLLGENSKSVYDSMDSFIFQHYDMERFKVAQLYNTKDNMLLIFENDILVGYVSGPSADRDHLKK